MADRLDDEAVGVETPLEVGLRVEIVLGLMGVLSVGVEIGMVVDRAGVLIGVLAFLAGLSMGWGRSVTSFQAIRRVIVFVAHCIVRALRPGGLASCDHIPSQPVLLPRSN